MINFKSLILKTFLLLSFAITFLMLNLQPCFAIEKPVFYNVDGNNIAFNDDTGYPYISQEGRTMMPLVLVYNSRHEKLNVI